MKLTVNHLKILLVLVVFGFGLGIYLQDLEHKKSTAHAWKANRYNLERFDRITNLSQSMNATNWRLVKDSISNELDTLMILRFRKEMDSLTAVTAKSKNEINVSTQPIASVLKNSGE